MKLSTNKNKHSGYQRSGVSALQLKTGALVAGVLVFFISLVFLSGMASRSKKPAAYIQKLKNGHYQLIVDRKPYIVKGICYNPIPIGANHEYDWWSDPNKPWLVDGKLMQEMGVNTIRVYQCGVNPEAVKKVIRDLYQLYGIRMIMGHWLGFWEYPCPSYGENDFKERVKKEVLSMIDLYKDEPGILFWVLGNENNYSFSGQVNPWSSDEIDKEPVPQTQRFMRAKIYYSFVNELVREIHQIDPNHPVALGNGELTGLDVAAKFSPDVDLIACIIYRGKTFGNLFNSLKAVFDKPIVLTEFGADAYDAYLNKEDQNMQAFFLESQWRQIYENLANNKEGTGNCLGGAIFEWSDEWWKHNESDPESWKIHDSESNWSNGSYYFDIKAPRNMNMNEEWFGIAALSEDLENGINKRITRKAYYVVREFWKNPTLGNKNKKKDKK